MTPNGVTTVGCSATEDRLDELLDDTLELELTLDVVLDEALELETELELELELELDMELELLVLIEDEEADEVEELVLLLDTDEVADEELETLEVAELDELDDETADAMLLEGDVPVALGTASPPPVHPVSNITLDTIVNSASGRSQIRFMVGIIAADNDSDHMNQPDLTTLCRRTEYQ